MYKVHIKGVRENKEGTTLQIFVPFESLTDLINRLSKDSKGSIATLYIDDGRKVTSEQRKAIFALIRDIAEWWCDDVEYVRKYFQESFCEYKDIPSFSLSHFNENCINVTTARFFITFLLEFTFKHDVPLSNNALSLTDDTDKYLYLCIEYKKCAICGRDGEIHHVDTIGMGNDRKTLDDSQKRKICLCREHHTQVHIQGQKFYKDNLVYGIISNKKADDFNVFRNRTVNSYVWE